MQQVTEIISEDSVTVINFGRQLQHSTMSPIITMVYLHLAILLLLLPTFLTCGPICRFFCNHTYVNKDVVPRLDVRY
jgi:hypothetical protein